MSLYLIMHQATCPDHLSQRVILYAKKAFSRPFYEFGLSTNSGGSEREFYP
jgi:hypothetical protein